MALGLHNLKPNLNSKRKIKRIGRGNASGHGTYSTRGLKGQRARSGGRSGLKQKGWRHILLSAPKLRGFKSLYSKGQIVNLVDLEKKFNDGEKITPQVLAEKKLIANAHFLVKILGKGELNKKLEIVGCSVSASAKEKIEKIGGQIK